MMQSHRAILTTGVLALVLAACGGSSADGDGGTIVQAGSAESVEAAPEERLPDPMEPQGPDGQDSGRETSSEASSDGLGTRGNPAPLGFVARVDDWELAIVSVTKDANAVVAEENEFNDPPEGGEQFVLWSVSATYVGEESGDPWLDFSWKILGSAGNTFDQSQGYCGVIPEPLSDQGETFPGGTVEGNVCIAVEIDQLDGALVILEGFFGEERTFFALG